MKQEPQDQRIVVLGAGGHAMAVIEVLLEAPRRQVMGCLSKSGQGDAVLGVPVLGGDDRLEALYNQGLRLAFVALGDNRVRRVATEQLRRLGYHTVAAVSGAAIVAAGCEVKAGAVVMPGAVIRAGASIGRGAIVNTAASVDHECIIEEFTHIAPGVRLAGNVHVGREALVGIGACVAPGIRIGEGAVIGAGSVVVRDIPGGAIAFGNPARPMRNVEERLNAN